MDTNTESTSTTSTVTTVTSSPALRDLAPHDVRSEAPPTEDAPPSGPPVSLKPCLRSRLPPLYDKRKRHPSIETESAKPCAKLRPLSSYESLSESRFPADFPVTIAPTLSESHEIPLPITPPDTSQLSKFNSPLVASPEPTPPPESPAIQPTKTHPKKRVTFADPLTNDLASLSLQPDNQLDDQPGAEPDNQMIPWATVSDNEIDTSLPDDHDFGATNATTWNLIKDQLILAEKCRGRAILAHNARLVERYPDWSLGINRIPCLMLPNSHRENYFALVRRQAQEKLLYMEEVLTTEADLCDRVAAIHTETMTRFLESDEDKRLFPLLRNRTAKLARSRSAAYGRRVYDNVAKHETTHVELEDALIEPLPYQEFQRVTNNRARNRSRSPMRGINRPRSRSPKTRPSGSRGPSGGPRPRGTAGGHQNNNRAGRQQAPATKAQSSQGRPGNNSRPRQTNNRRPQPQAADRASQPPQLSPGELARLRALINNGGH